MLHSKTRTKAKFVCAKGPVNGSNTDAPFATEVQSFLPLRWW